MLANVGAVRGCAFWIAGLWLAGLMSVSGCSDSSQPLGPSDPSRARDSMTSRVGKVPAAPDTTRSLPPRWTATFGLPPLEGAAEDRCGTARGPRVFERRAALEPTPSPAVSLALAGRPKLQLPDLLSEDCPASLVSLVRR